ncbi:hypothetical protein BBD40_26045 [Paenibacillus ihbetae]|uniref:Uncharacterized protein n=1 Tax=Paenibacillus ihbetae TaxID=1870820 RepID=A0ABX3JRJ5_9BACL|nr:hypothetical protein BBD40_26045 [Paenibacillus ihbetae]
MKEEGIFCFNQEIWIRAKSIAVVNSSVQVTEMKVDPGELQYNWRDKVTGGSDAAKGDDAVSLLELTLKLLGEC